MENHRNVSNSTLEIFIQSGDVPVDERDVIDWKPLEHARFAHETTHAPSGVDEQLDQVAADESSRSRYEGDTIALRHPTHRSECRTSDTCGRSSRPFSRAASASSCCPRESTTSRRSRYHAWGRFSASPSR